MKACAKVNLYLEITGRREDGYHTLRTLFLPLAGLYDTVTVLPSSQQGISLECDDPAVPTDSRNLCWKAAAAFHDRIGVAPRVHIRLEKVIPVAAGLGGGSSDAAATLLECRRLVAPNLPMAELRTIAVALGADVPFFLEPAPALAEGIGERLSPISVTTPLQLVLVNPGFPVAAAWAYQHKKLPPRDQLPSLDGLLAALRGGTWNEVALYLHNDLEYSVLEKFPILGMIRRSMEEQGCRGVHVSGSGPTVFGLCEPGGGEAVCAALQPQYGSFCRILTKLCSP